jgi:hypothetical protein
MHDVLASDDDDDMVDSRDDSPPTSSPFDLHAFLEGSEDDIWASDDRPSLQDEQVLSLAPTNTLVY